LSGVLCFCLPGGWAAVGIFHRLKYYTNLGGNVQKKSGWENLGFWAENGVLGEKLNRKWGNGLPEGVGRV
jgi:hypothetical protein